MTMLVKRSTRESVRSLFRPLNDVDLLQSAPPHLRHFIVHLEITDGDAGRIADSIRAAGFDQATRMAAEGYLDKARAALASLPSGPEQDILQQMADYVRDRKK